MKACTLPGGYNPSTKRISFNDDGNITIETLKEELFHVWQDTYYSGGIWQYRETGKVNIEFEAKVFKNIIAVLMEMGSTSAFYKEDTEEEDTILCEQYRAWMHSAQYDLSILQDQDGYNYWLDLIKIKLRKEGGKIDT